MGFVLPTKKQAGVLMNSDLAKEWGDENRVIMSDGSEVTWSPPPPKPVMPDWSEIKSIRHYFNRTHRNNFWPAWIYNHATGEERIVKNADEAAEYGICYRERTGDEVGRFGEGHVWDWKDDSMWRPQPKKSARRYDPSKPEAGKEFVATVIPQSTANRDLLNMVLPEVTAAVVAALKQSGSVAPDNIDSAQWNEFLAFQAWKKTQEAIIAITPDDPNQMSLIDDNDERAAWENAAEKKGIKPDKRWSLDTLKERVNRAA
jgi:hypothetical protein